jgi:hypothetical protein
VIETFGAEPFDLELQRARNLQLRDAVQAALTLAREAAPAPSATGSDRDTRTVVSVAAGVSSSDRGLAVEKR